MSDQPGEHLEEESQEERGPVGSRDTGPDELDGGPVDRPSGRADDEEEESDTSVDPQEPQDPDSPHLQSGG